MNQRKILKNPDETTKSFRYINNYTCRNSFVSFVVRKEFKFYYHHISYLLDLIVFN